MTEKRKGRIFFGWWIVLFTGILCGLGSVVHDYGGSALFKPIASELNLSRTVASVASGIGRLGTGVGGITAGWLADKFGPKWVIFITLCISAAGLASMYFVNSLWSYYLVWGVIIGTALPMAILIPIDKTLANWFIRKRGLAIGAKFTLISIVGMLLLPIFTWQVTEQGWRTTCLIWSGVWLAAAPFILWLVKQHRPEYYGLLPDGAGVESGSGAGIEAMLSRGADYASGLQEVEFTFRQALRTRSYWILVLTMYCTAVVFGGFSLHCIPFLTDRGIEPTAAGAMMGMMVLFTAPSRFFSGFISDRVKKNRIQFILAGASLLQILGMAAFLLDQSTAMIYVMLIFYGLGTGATGPVFLTIIGRYFGRKAYGSIMGSIQMLSAPVQLGAPVFAGWIYDTTGSYLNAFLVYIAASSLAAVILCLMRPPRAPEQITDVRQFM